MNSSTITTGAPDQSDHARHLIELGLAMDPEARSETLARLIAASLHNGPGSAVEAFASTGYLNQQQMLQELNDLRVPLDQEGWVDALGRFILATAGDRS